jgi:hypothetical protein
MKSLELRFAESLERIKAHGDGAVKMMNESWEKLGGESIEEKLEANERLIKSLPIRKNNGAVDNLTESSRGSDNDGPGHAALVEAVKRNFPEFDAARFASDKPSNPLLDSLKAVLRD